MMTFNKTYNVISPQCERNTTTPCQRWRCWFHQTPESAGRLRSPTCSWQRQLFALSMLILRSGLAGAWWGREGAEPILDACLFSKESEQLPNRRKPWHGLKPMTFLLWGRRSDQGVSGDCQTAWVFFFLQLLLGWALSDESCFLWI